MNIRVVAAYALMCAIWGTTWLGIKVALTGFPPVSGAGVRFIVAALFLYALRAVARPAVGEKPPLRLIFVLAATLFGGNYALTYFAETRLASGLVAVLFGTMPFFIAAFGFIMLRERVSVRAVIGAVLALGGVAVISLTGEAGAWLAIVATLIAAALSSFANVYLKRYAESDPFQTLPPAMLLAGSVMAIAGAIFEHPNPHAFLTQPVILATLYLSIAGSGIAFYLNHWLLQRLPTWTIGLSALLIPVIAVAVGAVVAHEAIGPREFVGAALVIAGVWLALERPVRSPRTIDSPGLPNSRLWRAAFWGRPR